MWFRSRSDGSEEAAFGRVWVASWEYGRAAEEWKGVSEGGRGNGLWAAYAGLWLGLKLWAWARDACCVGSEELEMAESDGEGAVGEARAGAAAMKPEWTVVELERAGWTDDNVDVVGGRGKEAESESGCAEGKGERA